MSTGGSSEVDDDLRTTSEALVADAERLTSIEIEKARRGADDLAVPALAEEAARLTREMAAKAQVQAQIIAEAQTESAVGRSAGTSTITPRVPSPVTPQADPSEA